MASKEKPEVTTTAGRLRGAWKDKGEIAVFRGVPFAAPPVGERRWRPPAPVQPWSGVRPATKNGPAAIQRATLIDVFFDELVGGQGWSTGRARAVKAVFGRMPRPKQSEDCLYLTVRSPQLDTHAKLPVMVWIHGGDHQDGAGSEPFYASNALAHQGVVTVTINYRLGLMGYFAHPELSAESDHEVAGNYGTLDQIAALEWVRDNIAAFGGDADNVTIFGESAGGESVMHLMTSPLAAGLFHRALPQSAANAAQMLHLRRPFLDFDAAETNSAAFARALGITGPGQLERLRDQTADDLYGLVRTADRLGDHYPVIDGYVLPESPLTAFAAGRQAKVPLLIGSNADEGTLLVPALGAPMVEYRHRPMPSQAMQPEVAEAFGDDLPRLVELYPGLDRRDGPAEIDFAGDYFFGARAYWYAQHHASAGQPTWMYLFTRTPPSPRQTAGAYHAAELPFVHGSSVPILPLTAEDKVLGARIREYWTSFALSGDPNGPNMQPWPAFDTADPHWLVLDHKIRAEPVDRADKYQVLNARNQRLVDMMAVAGVQPV